VSLLQTETPNHRQHSFCLTESSEQGTFFVSHQDGTKLLAHVHSAAFMGLGCTEMSHVVMPLRQDETVLVVLRLSKLDITPGANGIATFTSLRETSALAENIRHGGCSAGSWHCLP
jgi:hypothetical protein